MELKNKRIKENKHFPQHRNTNKNYSLFLVIKGKIPEYLQSRKWREDPKLSIRKVLGSLESPFNRKQQMLFQSSK